MQISSHINLGDTILKSDEFGRTALINAAIDGKRNDVSRLLDEGADPDIVDKGGWSAIHYASQRNDVQTIRLLLNAGANVHIKNDNGNTPLFRAVFSFAGNGDCITCLLEHGANPDEENDNGVSPRSLAGTIGNYDTSVYFD